MRCKIEVSFVDVFFLMMEIAFYMFRVNNWIILWRYRTCF